MKKIFVEIFARIWAAWGLLTFIITFLLFLIPSLLCYFIPGYKGQHIFILISKIWMKLWLTIIGCRVIVKGKEHFKKNTAYIVTCNHNALLDVPLSSPFIPGGNKTIAKTSFAKIPIFGLYYKKGSVLVDRRNDASRRKSFEEMRKVLAQGMHMCIYPEGTRNRSQEPLKKFYDGAFKLSVDTGVAIIPAVIFNTKKAMPINKKFYLLPKVLQIHFLEPILPKGLSFEDLNKKVYAVMKDYYLTHQ